MSRTAVVLNEARHRALPDRLGTVVDDVVAAENEQARNLDEL